MLNAKRAGRMKYVQYASRIRADLVGFEVAKKNRRSNILLSIRKALVSGRLQSLIISEGCFAPMTPSITSELFTHMGRKDVQLRELHIDLKDSLGERMVQCWGDLKQCVTLERLVIDISHDIFEAGPYKAPAVRSDDARLVMCLPESLREVAVKSAMSVQPRHEMWNSSFSANDFLPHLERLALTFPKHVALSADYFAQTLNQTIMKKTGKPRPIMSWTCLRFENLNFFDRLPLKEISLSCLSPQPLVEATLLKPPADFFPHIRRVAIHGMLEPFDLFPVISFASKRPVDHFMFILEKKSQLFSLADQSVKALANMKSLKILNLASIMPVFKSSDPSSLLPLNSWPHLEHIILNLNNPTEQQLRCIFAAAPNARSAFVAFESQTISQSLVAAMIAHYCRKIVTIHVVPSTTSDCTETMKRVQNAFSRYPVTDQSVQKLVSLSLRNYVATSPAVFHYFVRQISHAPILSCADLGTASVNTLYYCVTRSLPHIRVLNAPGVIHKRIQALGLKKLNDTITFRVTKGDWADKYLFEKALHPRESVFYYCESLEEMMTEDFLVDDLYPVFKEIVESGKTGRQQFYEFMHGLLSASDKADLADWEDGKYKSK